MNRFKSLRLEVQYIMADISLCPCILKHPITVQDTIWTFHMCTDSSCHKMRGILVGEYSAFLASGSDPTDSDGQSMRKTMKIIIDHIYTDK